MYNNFRMTNHQHTHDLLKIEYPHCNVKLCSNKALYVMSEDMHIQLFTLAHNVVKSSALMHCDAFMYRENMARAMYVQDAMSALTPQLKGHITVKYAHREQCWRW